MIKVTERLIKDIKKHEGYRAMPYQDHLGNWTVGYGHLIHELPYNGKIGDLMDKLTDEGNHLAWLFDDIEAAVDITQDWLDGIYPRLHQSQQEVFVEMAFQMGNRVRHFNRLKHALSGEALAVAVEEMRDSRWYLQTPARVEALIRKFME